MTNAIELHPLRLEEKAVLDGTLPLCNNPPFPLFDIEEEKVPDDDVVASTEVSTFNKFIANVIKAVLLPPPPLDIVRLLFIILLYIITMRAQEFMRAPTST